MSAITWIAAIFSLFIGWIARRELAMRERRETQAMWEQQLRKAETQRDQRKVSIQAKTVRIAKLETDIQRYGNDLDQLRRKVAEREFEVRDLEDSLRHQEDSHRQSSRRVLELADKAEILQRERDQHLERKIAVEAENLLFREMVSTAEIALLERGRTIEELRSRPKPRPLDRLTQPVRKPETGTGPKIDPLLELLDLEEEFTPRGTPIPDLEAPPLDPVQATPPEQDEDPEVDTQEVEEEPVIDGETRPVAVLRENPDDLTQIKGIGPAFARRLEAIGITHFAQIADWNEDDLEEAATALNLSAKRIRKNGWVKSAQALV